MFRWLVLALLLSASSASAFEPWTDCGKNMNFFEKPAYEAKSPKDGLYIEMPDNVGTMELATVRIHVNDPAVRKNANIVEFLCDPVGCAVSAGEKAVDDADPYPHPYMKYAGEDVIELRVRNTHTNLKQGGVTYFSARFVQVKAPLAAGEYELCNKDRARNGTAWYGFSCERDRNYKGLCGSDKCDIAYMRIGHVGKQFMSHLLKMQSKPPAAATNRPSSNGPLDEVYQSRYEGYQATAPNGQQRYCSRGMTIGVYPTAEMESVTLINSWYGDNAKKYQATQPPGGLAAGKTYELRERDAASAKACDGEGCNALVDYDMGYTIISDMAPEGTGTIRASVSRKDCVAKSRLKAEIEKTIAETKAFLASYKAAEQAPGTYRGMVCTDVKPEPTEPGTLSGRVTDGHGRPMPYVKLTLTSGGKEYPEFADERGEYRFRDVKGLKPDEDNPPEASIKVEFSYVRDGKYYVRIVDDSAGGDVVEYERRFSLKDEAGLRQDIDFAINAPEGKKSLKSGSMEESSTSRLRDLGDIAPIYAHLAEAVDFALAVLKADIDYKLPVDVYVGGQESVYYSRPSSSIAIGAGETHYGSMHRPDNREYHEFGHHIMFSQWNGDTIRLDSDRNHGGFANSNTADSFTEGFAEFIAMAVAERVHDPGNWPPDVYGGYGSYEDNIKVWERWGKSEERAVCGALWDLYDAADPADNDSVSIPMDDMWSVLKVKRPTFYEYYKAFRSGHPDKAAGIDQIMVNHGIFADNNTGNKACDPFEPWLADSNGNKVCDMGDKWVDYGIAGNVTTISRGPGEAVGKAANYERPTRGMAGYIPTAFLRVQDGRARTFKVAVDYADPARRDYEYGTEWREGRVYVAPLPEGADAVITVTVDSRAYAAEKPYVVSAKDYDRMFYAAGRDGGSFAAHDFKLKPTGLKDDSGYGTFQGAKPVWDSDGGYDVLDDRAQPKGTVDLSLPGGLDAKSVCPCLPLLPLVLAGLASALARL